MPSSYFTSGVRNAVPRMRSRAASTSSSVIGLTGSTISFPLASALPPKPYLSGTRNPAPAWSLRRPNKIEGGKRALDHSRHPADPDAHRRAAALGAQRELGLRTVGNPRRDPGRHRHPAADGTAVIRD